MAMKLTQHQQEMLDGKLGEAKKFCMEKLVDFGEAVEAKEMVDARLCPQLLSHLLEGSPESRDEEETRAIRPGTQPALRSDLRDEGRPCRGRNGHRVRKRSVPGAVRQGRREGLPLELRASGQGQLQGRRRNGHRPQGGLRQAAGAWLAPLALVPTSWATRASPRWESTAPAPNPAPRPTSTPSWAPAPIGNPPSTRSTPPTPAACPSTAATSTRIGRPNASSSWMTRPGTTWWAPRTGRPWAPASPKRRRTGSWPCSTCPRRWARRRPSSSSPAAPPA